MPTKSINSMQIDLYVDVYRVSLKEVDACTERS